MSSGAAADAAEVAADYRRLAEAVNVRLQVLLMHDCRLFMTLILTGASTPNILLANPKLPGWLDGDLKTKTRS